MKLPPKALQLAGFVNGSRAYVGPTVVQVDLTDACDQSCQVCWLHAPPLRGITRGASPASLPWRTYLRLLDDLRALGTEEIYLAGGGEPLLYPRAWEALGAALDRGFTTSLHTNFSQVGEAGVRRLLDLRVHHVTVSLWAATDTTWERTHPGSDVGVFHAVQRRLRQLNEQKHDRPLTKLYHVLTADNAHETEAMVELAGALGCDTVELAVADTVPGFTSAWGLDSADAAELIEVLTTLRGRAPWRRPRLLGLEDVVSRLECVAHGRDPDAALVHEQPCFAGWSYARVLADGRVIPCLKSHRLPSGDLARDDFPTIWNGAPQQRFREASRSTHKVHPLLAEVGNDRSVSCGCERGCDNLALNRNVAARYGGLTAAERALLRAVASSPRLARLAGGTS